MLKEVKLILILIIFWKNLEKKIFLMIILNIPFLVLLQKVVMEKVKKEILKI